METMMCSVLCLPLHQAEALFMPGPATGPSPPALWSLWGQHLGLVPAQPVLVLGCTVGTSPSVGGSHLGHDPPCSAAPRPGHRVGTPEWEALGLVPRPPNKVPSP